MPKSLRISFVSAVALALYAQSTVGQPAEPASLPASAASAPEGSLESSQSAVANEGAEQVRPNESALVKDVKVIERPFFHGSGLFAMGGAIGGLLAAGVYKDEPERIAAFVKQERIDIPGIVTAEFERQLEQNSAAKQALQQKGPGKFQMRILYGITSVPFSDYRPYLSIRMSFIDDMGTEKWKDREYVGGHGNAKAIPYPDFLKSADIFKGEFEVAANEVTALLLKNLSR